MNHIVIKSCLAALLVSLCFSVSFAQKDGHDLAIGASFGTIPAVALVQYEFRVGDDGSVGLRALYATKTDNYTGFGFGGTYRFFINDDRPLRGLSVGPAVEAYFFTSSESKLSSRVFTLGGDGAYKLLFGQFSAELQVSLRFGLGGSQSVPKFTTTLVYPTIFLGYAW